MGKYIFYTSEGFTQSPTNIETENFQILGFSDGENPDIALTKLLKQNPWISDYGFNVFKIQSIPVSNKD